MTKKPKIIFFGNGPLAEATFTTLEPHFDIIFHAKTREDLKTAEELKTTHPEAHGVLASYGVIIPKSTLKLFEPEGILNLHPSLLPLYRGPSPIESAILAGDTDFSVSIMKLAPAMDAGPIYFQTTLKNLPLNKTTQTPLTPPNSPKIWGSWTPFQIQQSNFIARSWLFRAFPKPNMPSTAKIRQF